MFTQTSNNILLILLGVIAVVNSLPRIDETLLDPVSDEFISYINSKATTWKAGRNFNKETAIKTLRTIGRERLIKNCLSRGKKRKLQPLIQDQRSRRHFDDNVPEYLKNMVWYKTQTHKFDALVQNDIKSTKIPDEFDLRIEWPNCPSIREIRTQGCCGACWLIAPVEVMTDRVCIHSNGTQHFHFSTEDVLTCYTSYSRGCDGDFSDEAWIFWVEKGIVSGGPYNSNEGCKPYSISPSCPGDTTNNSFWTPPCMRFCRDGYNKTYEEDKHYGKKVYFIQGGEKAIQQEIMENGPVAAVLQVYADFVHYRTGVYTHVSGEYIGTHAVKIIGWGLENGTIPYWIGANSSGTRWGENGFFRILRGSNECEIETFDITAGIPQL